ncbi:MAG: hypothetical protein WBD11_06850 [Xanthobacteraceae bacterium]
MALLLLALAIALPTAPLGPEGKFIFVRCLVLGTICLIGRICLKVLHIGANLYLRNFRIDAPDNLMARKHVTQVRVSCLDTRRQQPTVISRTPATNPCNPGAS